MSQWKFSQVFSCFFHVMLQMCQIAFLFTFSLIWLQWDKVQQSIPWWPDVCTQTLKGTLCCLSYYTEPEMWTWHRSIPVTPSSFSQFLITGTQYNTINCASTNTKFWKVYEKVYWKALNGLILTERNWQSNKNVFVTLSQRISAVDELKWRQWESNEYCFTIYSNFCSHETHTSSFIVCKSTLWFIVIRAKLCIMRFLLSSLAKINGLWQVKWHFYGIQTVSKIFFMHSLK